MDSLPRPAQAGRGDFENDVLPRLMRPILIAMTLLVPPGVERIEALVLDGLRLGFFEYTLACEIGSGGKR